MDGDPNLFAYVALVSWPLVALYLYRRLSVAQATIWTILGGYLLLPVGVDMKIPMIPDFTKSSIANLSALLGCILYARRPPRVFQGFGLVEVLLFCTVFGPFLTSMLNGDEIQIGNTSLPGVGAYDGGSAVIAEFMSLLSFFLARQFLRSAEDNAEILRVLVIAGLAYSLPILFEVRMSPQLNRWIYGYAFTNITGELRNGGFRPEVFLGLGLTVAFFSMTTAVAAAALWRTKTRVGRLPLVGVTAYLSFVLVLCKALGSLTYGAVAVPLVRWANPRTQLVIACVLVTVTLAYPMLRVADVFPTTTIFEVAQMADKDRADSLNTRFYQESQLLARALERPWFGWGRYGRSRVYHGYLGADSSLTDGLWVIVLGSFGLVGFATTFGLMALPVFRAAAALKFARSPQERSHLAALALIVSIIMIDQLPNASFSTWSWLLIGALLGRTEALFSISSRRAGSADMGLLAGRSTS